MGFHVMHGDSRDTPAHRQTFGHRAADQQRANQPRAGRIGHAIQSPGVAANGNRRIEIVENLAGLQLPVVLVQRDFDIAVFKVK